MKSYFEYIKRLKKKRNTKGVLKILKNSLKKKKNNVKKI